VPEQSARFPYFLFYGTWFGCLIAGVTHGRLSNPPPGCADICGLGEIIFGFTGFVVGLLLAAFLLLFYYVADAVRRDRNRSLGERSLRKRF
jgi:hypothetical protein